MGRINLLEEEAEGARGREKTREWERKPKVGRFLADKDLLNEAKVKDEEPPHSNVLHVGNRFPKEPKPKNSGKGNGKKPIIPAKPKVETIVQQSLSPESDEEKLSRLEARIQSSEFSDAEREFFEVMVKKYPHELQVAKEKIEKKGGIVDEKWAILVRTSYINERKRLGLEKNRWGVKIPLVPEKADLFETYLNLKLPAGIPEEKLKDIPKNVEETRDESLKDLTITNKNMEISVKDTGKKTKKESFPVGAGYMGAPVDLDAREAEEVKARRTGTEDKKEKEPEFSPEEVEEIKKIAHYISECRMAGDSEEARKKQEELAKEYGLDENDFSKEAIEKLLSDNDVKEQWTPKAQKFMQDWDWGKAEEAFRNMKKEREKDSDVDAAKRQEGIQKGAWELFKNRKALDPDNEETEPSEFDLRAATAAYDAVQKQDESEKSDTPKREDVVKRQAKEPFYYPVVISGSERERSVVPVKSDVYVAEQILRAPQLKALEGATEKTLEDLKADLDAKADAYATARGNAKGSRGYLAKLLGISKNVEESGEVKKARLEYLQAKLEHSKVAAESAFKEYQDKLQGGTTSPEELEVLRIKWESISNYHNRASDIELQGKFVEKTIEYYNTKGGVLGKVFGKYLDLYNNVYLKKVPPKVRAAISIAMMGGAVAGLAGAFGVTGIFVGAASVVSKPARFLLAPLFPAMTYMGTGKMMEKGLQWQYGKKGKKRSAAFGEVIGKMKSGEASVEETRKNILKLLEEQNKECGDDLVNRGWWEDRCDQVRNLLTTVVGARATMVLMSGTEAIGSFFEGKGNMAGVAGSSPKGALYTQGSGGKTMITPEGMKAVENASPGSAKLSPGEYQQIREHPYFSEPEVQTPEIAKPQFEEIDSVKTNTGGSMWKGIENSIRANPAAYHLDSSDSNFRKIMNGKIAEMLHDFADKKGLSYEQLDKVFTDDTFKLMHDNATGKFYLDDYQGKAFGGNVSHDGAGAAQEIASNKPNMPVEDVKQKAGIAPEDAVKTRTGLVPKHQPVRGAEKTMQYEPDTLDQKIAKEDFAKADQYQKDLRAYNAQEAARLEVVNEAANEQLRLSTSAEVKELFYGSGVSLRTNILDKPMSAWENLIGKENYIAQDVQLTDKTRVASFNKLKNLRLILERYNTSGSETIGECLSKAVKDTKVMYMIRKLVF